MSAGRLVNYDGDLELTVSVYDVKGTCWMEVPVRLGPYNPEDGLKKEEVSEAECIAAIVTAIAAIAAARTVAPEEKGGQA